MKIFLASILICLTMNPLSQAQDLSDIEWILGSWVQETETEGLDIVESWKKLSPKQFRGENIASDNEGNVVRTEIMTLEMRGSDIYYTAQPDPDKQPVSFKVDKVEDNYFIARNRRNPFPQQIVYTRTPTGLTADLSGRGRLIQIIFKEIEFVKGD